MRFVSRLLFSLALPSLASLFSPWATSVARAQGYRPVPDSAHQSVPPPYPWQGGLPIQQQDDPRITPGQPLEAAPGVPNGPPALSPVPPGGRLTHRSAPPTPPPERVAMGQTALITRPDSLAFHADGRLPRGLELATIKALPDGGEELYLRIPAGRALPGAYCEGALDLVVGRGEVTLLVEGRPVAAGPGTHASLPARTAHGLRCEAGERAERGEEAGACLLFLRSDGPYRPRYLEPGEAGPR